MKLLPLEGVWTALITPFQSNGEIDFPSFKNLLKRQLEANISGIITCCTTSETPTLNPIEKQTLIQIAVEICEKQKVPVFAGVGTNNTRESIETAKSAVKNGAHGILVVTPYYNKPSQKGLEMHFRQIANSVSCPILLYHVPGRTGVCLTAQTIARLSTHPQIYGLKESTGSLTGVSDILHAILQTKQKPRSPVFSLLAGDDVSFLPFYALGARGVVSVTSNLIPKIMVSIYKTLKNNQFKKAQILHQKYYPLFRDLFIETNPTPIKHAMAYYGLCSSHVRLPLTPLSNANAKKLEKTLKDYAFHFK